MLLNLILDMFGGQIGPWEALLVLVFSLVALMLVFPVHECAHGLMALAFGDKTAKYQGRLSLNPLVHIDLKGFLFLLVFGFGWAKPVQINPYNFKHRRLGTIMTSVAGPLSNIIFCFVSLFLYGFFYNYGAFHEISWMVVVADLFWYMTIYNATFAVFNLIPFPPLDGSKIVGELLPLRWRIKYYNLEQYSFYFFLVLIILLNRFDILGYFTYGIIKGFIPIVDTILGGIL
ncbi:MAG: site-2 protease family protein [Clostridia bacterium]|nr:site-2 protease family protein [Clostridia bacterium]